MNILYPLIEDRAWATDRIIKLEKENVELEAENEELRVAAWSAVLRQAAENAELKVENTELEAENKALREATK